MSTEEIWRVEATIELEVPKDMVEDVKKLKEELTDEFVKVKGGQYENIALGYITTINSINPNTREWK